MMSRRSSRRNGVAANDGPPAAADQSSFRPDPIVSSMMMSAPARRDTSKDVLYAKGAAAQTSTNPGNLLFYKLCEERYDEYTTLAKNNDPHRHVVAGEVVDAITATGGKFRKQTGGVMNRADAIKKTTDRFRQIAKPKLRPTGFGDDDVVFAKGAANFLYQGNAKWRQLCDGYVLSYYRDLVDEDGNVILDGKKKNVDTTMGTLVCSQQDSKHQRQSKNGKFKKGNKLFKRTRPQYQYEIIDEIINIIHGRGGVFRDEMLNVLSNEDAGARVHARFKDLKKQLLAGTRIFAPRDNKELVVKTEDHGDGSTQCIVPDRTISSTTEPTTDNNKKADGSSATITGTDIFHHRLGGFTSVRVTVRSINEKKALERKERSERRRNRRKMRPTRCRGKSTRGTGCSDDDDDDDSFQSNLLDSDNDSISSGDGDDGYRNEDDAESEKRVMEQKISKQKQDKEREERLKRRKSGIVNQQPPVETMKPKQRRQRAIQSADEESSTQGNDDNHPLSEYEMYRLEKIKRNEDKLAELGLLNKKRKREEKRV